jgi:thiosulfate/3-mercaptopyruvate sulfurtransferase
MSSPFVSVAGLAVELGSGKPPIVLDASLVLHPPKADGDYRRDSGRPRWVEAHIPGSQHVDVSTQFSDPTAQFHYTHPSPQAIVDELARIGVGEFDDVVVYDTTGTLWAARLWYLLRWVGVPVRVLDGGLAAWNEAGLPTETGETPSRDARATWSPRVATEAWITKEELLARTGDDDRPLVCGLPASSFTGDAPTRYSRRGRIPGSVNVSSRDLFGEDGLVRPDDEVRAEYRSARVAADSPEVLLYCGGGISASANALTLDAIGVTRFRIYDGSLEEWSADPALPLLTGS